MIAKLLGLSVLIFCLVVVFQFEHITTFSGVLRLIHPPAIFLTLIGPFALVFVCSDWRSIIRALSIVLGPSQKKLYKMHETEGVLLQKMGKSYYTDGPQVFEKVNTRGLSPFVKKMLDRLSVRMPISDIRELLEIERDRKQVLLTQALQVLELGTRLTPSVGMLGTIIGMVKLLSVLKEPSHIGSMMSLALLTTFFGLFFSLVIWTPFQEKVERVRDAEMDGYNQALRWLELLESKKPTSYFTDYISVIKPRRTPQKEAA